MKKLLLASLFFFNFNGLLQAQVVDIVGIGVKGVAESTLSVSDFETIEKLEVGAFYKGGDNDPASDDVLFSVYNKGPVSQWNTDVIIKHVGSPIKTMGYFSESFESVDGSGIDLMVKPTDYVHSFYTYVFRNDLTSASKSYTKLVPTFYYHNGAADPYVYNVAIDAAINPRQVKVKIPVSELDETPRMVNIKIQAGPVSLEAQENTWNYGNSFFLGEYTLDNVPGDVKKVSVSIYSPSNSNGEKNGDSFFVSGIVVDVEKVGCTLTQGYWKNHSECKQNGNGPQRDDTWDNVGDGVSPETSTMFFKSEQTYCEVFDTKPNNKNGKYYILAHQYIATELNLFNNADPTDIAIAFKKATEFLEKYSPMQVKGNKNLEAMAVSLGAKLDDYNNGRTGRGHCDENDKIVEHEPERLIIKKTLKKNRVKIYPNPVSSTGQIFFKANKSGETLVEIYNISGQKIGELFHGKFKKGTDVVIEFNTSHLKKGLYFALIKNGTDIYRNKISVTR